MISFVTVVLPALILCITTFLVKFVLLPRKKVQSYKQEGVTTYFFPILGFLKYMQDSMHKKGDIMASLKETTKVQPNAKYMATNMNGTLLIVLQGPQYIKEFLLNQNVYHKASIVDRMKVLGGHGLAGAEDETWKRHRRIISSSFNFEFLRTNIPVIQNTATAFFEKLTEKDYENYSVISRIQDITGETVGRIFFGENLNSYTMEGESLTHALAYLSSELANIGEDVLFILFGVKILYFSLIPKYRRIMNKVKEFRRICFEIIQDRKSKSQPESDTLDLLSSLLATQQLPDPNNRFSDEDIVDEFITFFLAGMDTTGHLIGMALYNLAIYPEYLQQLQVERENTYDKGKELAADTLTKMEILHSFLKETLRFYNPAPVTFMRKAIQDHELLDLKIKKGEFILPAFLTPAFDEKNFENATQFNPLRWMSSEGKIDPYAFTPFSAGPRNCIGQHLAMMEAKVIISEFLKRFDFKLKDGYQLKMAFRFLYEPQEELLFDLTPKAI